jgi:WD40 repeat protein
MRAVEQRPTSQALFSLRAAIDASPLLRALPGAPNPGSCTSIGLLRTSNNSFSAAYRPDGSTIAEGACDGTLLLLDPAGRVNHREHLAGGAGSIAFSPDGELLAAGGARGVRLLDPITGAVRSQLTARAPATAMAFSPDGSRLAAASPLGVTVWDLRAAGPRPRLLVRSAHLAGTMAFSHDGGLLLVGGDDGAAHVYDARSGRPVASISAHAGQGGQWPEVVAVSPDGAQLAIGHPTNGPLAVTTIYDARTFRRLSDIATIRNVEISALAFSADGTRLAIGAEDGTAGVWSVRTRQQLVSYEGQTAAVDAMQFSPDGQTVITASNDGTARLWRAHGSEQTYIETGQPGSPRLVLAGRRVVAVGQVGAPAPGRGPGFALLSWSLPDGRPLPSVPLPVPPGGVPNLSHDGRLVVVGPPPATKGPAFIYSVAERRVIHRFPPVSVVGAEMSWDDAQIVVQMAKSASAAGPAFDDYLASGRQVPLQGTPPVDCGGFLNTLSFSRDNRWISGSTFCGQAYLWDARSGRLARRVQEGGEVSDTDPSPDGSRLLVGSWDSRATVWDVRTGRPLVTLVGHTRGIDGAQFSPDGSLILTGSLDHTSRLWDARNGHVLRVFNFVFDPGSFSFSADGRSLVIDDDTGVARVWNTCPGCGNPPALLALARQGATSQLTTLERAVVGSS